MAGNDIEIRVRVRDFASPGLRAVDTQARAMRGTLIGAAGAMARLGAGGAAIPVLLGVASAAQAAAGALLLLPGAAAAGASIAGTLGLALGGVSEALTATTARAGSAGGAVVNMARQIRDANRAIQDAHRGVEDANRALEDAYRGVEDAVRGVEDAERSVERAVRAHEQALREEERALQAVRDAAAEAEQNLADLEEQQSDAARSVTGANLALQRAEANLLKVRRDGKATTLDRAEAEHRVEEARDSLSDAERKAAETTDKLTDAQAKGIENSDAMVAAQEQYQQAQQRTADAADAVADAERGVADARRGVEDANRRVEDAERGVEDARQAVIDAEQNLRDVLADQAAAAQGAAGGIDAYAEALAKLSPNARAFVETLRALRPEWEAMQRSVQDRFFAGFADDVRLLAGTYIPLLDTGLGGIATSLNGMARYAMAELLDPSVVEDINGIFANTSLFLDNASTALGDFLAGFASLAEVGTRYLPGFGQWIADIAAGFRTWAEEGDAAGGPIETMINNGIEGFKTFWQICQDLWGTIQAIIGGLSGEDDQGFLGGMLEGIRAFAEDEATQTVLGIIGDIARFLVETAPMWIPVVAGMYAAAGAMAVFNAVMAANPIGLVVIAIGALVGGLIWAYNNVEWFRNMWDAIWSWASKFFGDQIRVIVDGVNWLGGQFLGFVGWLQGIDMWGWITSGLKGAANGAISLLNGLVRSANAMIYGINVVSPFGDIPYIPYIPYLARGGIAGGMAVVGEAGPELVRLPQGSTVYPTGQSQRMAEQLGGGGGGGAVRAEIELVGDVDSAFATYLMKLVREGKLQIRAAA